MGRGGGDRADAPQEPADGARIDLPPATAATESGTGAERAAGAWDLVSSGEGAALVYPGSGATAVRLFCPSGSDRLLVNVPGFRAVGSEERMTFGSGGTAPAGGNWPTGAS